jgi:aryl-alcohol dehydrogenase-like predicted oxidoreductase
MRDRASMPVVPLGARGPEVSRFGLGCMVLTGTYAPPDPDEAVATFERALELGITLLDTADSYSDGANERFLAPLVAARRDDVVLATKFGLEVRGDDVRVNGRPEYARACCDGSLARLGVRHLDVYYLHRIDPDVPVEETVGAMSELVEAGKVRHLGLSEASADQLRRAHGVHPITALQSEWSLFERRIERQVVPVARELGIGIVPYSPLGRGFLTGAITSSGAFAAEDFRSVDPRFSGDNLAHNLRLVEPLHRIARTKGATPGQVALAWLHAQGSDVVPIPGAERREYLDENVASLDVTLSDDELRLLDETFREGAVAGNVDALVLREPDAPDPAPAE